jgi:hypothetical protein
MNDKAAGWEIGAKVDGAHVDLALALCDTRSCSVWSNFNRRSCNFV